MVQAPNGKKYIELWHAIVVTSSFLIILITIIVQLSNKIQMQGDRIVFLQEKGSVTDGQLTEISIQLKQVNETLLQIRLDMKDKQDRAK